MPFIEIVEADETFDLWIGDSKLTLRRFDSETYKQIEKKYTKKEKNFRSGGWIKDVDEYAVNEDLLDYMIVSWEGIKSPTTGGDVPCTRENKLKLPGSIKVRIIEECDADHIGDGKKKEPADA